MSRSVVSLLALGLGLSVSCGVPAGLAAEDPAPDWSGAVKAMGLSGSHFPGGVFKIGIPRRDLHVTLGGVTVKPALALGGWLGMIPMSGGEVMGMGDLVLTVPEVQPVVRKLLAEGVDVTAIHNHLLGERPQLLYLHYMAKGTPTAVARDLRDALALTGTPLTPAPAAKAAPVDLDAAAIGQILGAKGNAAGGVLQFGILRAKPITEEGTALPGAMGVASPLNFQPLGGGRAAITGDLVMIPSEVEPVMRALAGGGIEITALHSHMLDESPRIFFLHFWATGDAIALAHSLRQALDHMDVKLAE